MNCNASNSRRISRGVMASAIAITLGMTALAQDSPQLAPHAGVPGKIDIRNANIAAARHSSGSQHCARPRTGTERRGAGM